MNEDAPAIDPFARYADMLPAGAVPMAMVGVLEFLDSDGDASYVILHVGTIPVSTAVGLFELGKAQVIKRLDGGG